MNYYTRSFKELLTLGQTYNYLTKKSSINYKDMLTSYQRKISLCPQLF